MIPWKTMTTMRPAGSVSATDTPQKWSVGGVLRRPIILLL
jgi:hypothetical protein